MAKIAGAIARGAHVVMVPVEDLGAGVDFANRPIFVAPSNGAKLRSVGIVPHGASAGIDNANTAVVDVKDAVGNTIVSRTYNTATQPPAANAYGDLGALDATHQELTANEVLTLSVTQGATANLPAFSLALEYDPYA